MNAPAPEPTHPIQPPLPTTISDIARLVLEPMMAAPPPPANLDPKLIRPMIDAIQQEVGKLQLKRYPVNIEDAVIAGVPVRIFTPPNSRGPSDAVLLNLHGGGFVVDSGSMTENIPVAALTGMTVVAVLYRLAPEHPYPAAVDDALAVYAELLKTHAPSHVVVFGTSAGAVLTTQMMARLRRDALPPPAAIGVFAGTADMSQVGDSEQYLPGINGQRSPDLLAPYLAGADPTDPAISPILGDLSGFPWTLIVSSTRDVFMSQSAIFHRALLRAGVRADLVVFEAMPHAFWAYLETPEGDEAFQIMARFFEQAVSGASF